MAQLEVSSPPPAAVVRAPSGTAGPEEGTQHRTRDEALHRLLRALVERLPQLLDDVEALLRGSWPEYADFLVAERDEVRAAATLQLPALLTTAVGPPRAADGTDEQADAAEVVFEEIGAAQWRQGQDLPRLLGAYQSGAGIAWRHVAAAALDVGVEPRLLTELAESVFHFVDLLSSASTRGYLREQSEAAVCRERLREELADLLTSGRVSTASLRPRAAQAGWALPATAAVVVFDAGAQRAAEPPVRLEGTWLPLRRPGLLGAVVPAGAVHDRGPLVRALAGAGAVVGPFVPLADLPSTLTCTAVAARLRRAGILADEPVFVEDHLDTVLVHRDEQMLATLREQVLAPLAGLAAPARERLLETLEVWLRHQGSRSAVAEELHVHPQTVRYRVDQLRALMGEEMVDPRARLRLLLALAWGAPDASDVSPPSELPA